MPNRKQIYDTLGSVGMWVCYIYMAVALTDWFFGSGLDLAEDNRIISRLRTISAPNKYFVFAFLLWPVVCAASYQIYRYKRDGWPWRWSEAVSTSDAQPRDKALVNTFIIIFVGAAILGAAIFAMTGNSVTSGPDPRAESSRSVMDANSVRPAWLTWLLGASREWVYVAFRIISLFAGLVMFFWGWVKALIWIFRRSRTVRAFLIAWLLAFGGAVFGWGWPMYLAAKYHLSKCNAEMLFIGKTWGDGRCPDYPRF